MKYASPALTTFAFLPGLLLIYLVLSCRCTIDNRVTRVAWLNRSTILYAGNDKWCLDPRVVLLSNTQTQYSIEIQNVDVYDEGPYTCSVQTDNHPKTSRVHLIVQGGWGLAGRPEWVAGNINSHWFYHDLNPSLVGFCPQQVLSDGHLEATSGTFHQFVVWVQLVFLPFQ